MEFLVVFLLVGTLWLAWVAVARWLRARHVVIRHLAGSSAGFFCMLSVAALLSACGLLETKPTQDQAVAPPAKTSVDPKPPLMPLAPPPPPPKEVEPSPEAAAPQPTPASLGSKAAFQAWFKKLEIEFTSSPLADGTPRSLGSSVDKLTNIELTGGGDRLQSATLMFGVDNSNPTALVRTTGALMVFMRELGWKEGHTWVVDQMAKEGGEIEKNGVHYRFTVIKSLGINTLVATPANK